MKSMILRVVLLALAAGFTMATSCYVSGGYVGYGYTHSYYDDVFYRPPIDRYGYGFYGHP